MSIDRKKLGAAIRDMRSRRGMTQVDLARAAGLSESGNTVALIERGERGVSIEAMNRIAGALDLPAGCLAILGSVADSGHPRSVGLLKSLQDLVTSTVDLQQELRQRPVVPSARTSKPRRTPVNHR